MGKIILRRSAVSGKVPTTDELNLGEIAINTADGLLFFKKKNATTGVESIITVSSGSGGGGSGTPGGSNTQLQYNNSNTFGGTVGLTWNSGTSTLTGTFSGPLTGNADTATALTVASNTNNQEFYPTFVTTVASTAQNFYGNSGLKYNPSLNRLALTSVSASAFTGSLQGTSSWAVSASWAPSSGGGSLSGGATNYIPLWTSATTLSSSSLYQTGSSIGINTTNPILGLTAAGQGVTITALNTGNSGSATLKTYSSASNNTTNSIEISSLSLDSSGSVYFGTSGSKLNSIVSFGESSSFVIGTYGIGSLIFGTNNTARVFISSSGNIGINTIYPTLATLQVNGNISASSFTGSHFGTSSWAVSASWAPGGGSSTPTFPYTGSAIISGSLTVTGSLIVTLGISGSLSGSLSGSHFGTSSWATSASIAISSSYSLSASYALSGSFTSTASYVNTLNQNVLITGSLTVGTSSLGSNENTLILGVPPSGIAQGEGGQLLLQAPMSASFVSASMLDNYQNRLRILTGTNVNSNAEVASFNMHTKQASLPAYTAASSFPGTATANLAVDSGGNIITVSTSGGTVFPYTGIASINGGLIVTGSITASSAIHAQANGAMYFRGGDDAELWDINVANTVGVYGQQDQTVASIKLGSGGGTISGRSGSIGIGTTLPTSGTLHVSGNIFATSLTGSLFGTSSWAVSASWAPGGGSSTPTFPYTGSAIISGSLIVTGSTLISSTNSTQFLVGTSSLFVSSSGNVGVGTTASLEKFVVEGDGTNIIGQSNILLNSKSTLATGYSSIIFKNTNTATTVAEIKAVVGSGYTTNTLGLFVQGSERINISNTGVQFLSASVNLLTVSSSSVISISGSINFPNNASAYNVPQIRLRDYVTGVTLFSNDMVALVGNNIGVLAIKGVATPYVILKSTTLLGWGSDNVNGSLDTAFSRLAGGRIALGTGAASDNTGTLVLGKLGINGISNPTRALEVSGSILMTGVTTISGSLIMSGSSEFNTLSGTNIARLFYNNVEKFQFSGSGVFLASDDIVGFYSFSDQHLKKDIRLITSSHALEQINKLQGVYYKWIGGGSRGDKEEIGLIAQQVQTVVPEVVRNKQRLGQGEYKTVDYEHLVALLIEGMKEQQKQIDELKNRLDAYTK